MTPAKQLSSVQVQTNAQGRLVLRTNNPSKTAQPVNARLPEVTGQELGDLFFPITPEAFTAAYWGRQPLFVKGSVEKLERLIPGGFGREDFFRVARETTEKGLVNFKLQAGYYQGIITDDEATPRPFVPITPDQMEPMFAAGANLMADYLHEPRLAKLVAALKTQLQHAGTIDFLLTLSPQSNGWRPHLDRTSVIAVQLEGTKRYVISPGPVQAWPRGTATIGTDGQVTSYEYDAEAYDEIPLVDMSSLYEVVLEPGDLLYLPSGTIHSTAATTGHTLNLNLLFAQANFTDLLSRVL